MKKQYIKPSSAVYTFTITHMVSESVVGKTENSAIEGFDGGGEGNTNAREDNIDNYRGSIWDNAW